MSPKTTTLVDGYKRYIQEIDITASVTTSTDQGITPIIHSGDLSSLDWTGVQMVEESWRPSTDGSGHVTRQRFYRNARWMKNPSAFAILPFNSHGGIVGAPLFANAGGDDMWRSTDDGFVRRFVARQVVHGCASVGDCSNATSYIAEGLVQFRDALHPDLWASMIPPSATKLGLLWTSDPTNIRMAPVDHVHRNEVDWGYGFVPKVEVSNPPANGQYYVPGESLDLRLSFFDGEGNRFFAPGAMPSYGDFLADNIPNGLRYYDGFREDLELYYALKHREANMIVNVSGPTNKLKFSSATKPGLFDLFLPQTTFADRDVDGFTSIATLQPPALAELDPTIPVSDIVHFVVPSNAEAGTYLVVFKARRDYGGEALNRVARTEIQIGQTAKSSDPVIKTGRCENCHSGQTSFSNILHGGNDRRACFGCHAQLGFEPNHALDCRVHKVHSASNRFPGNVHQCSTCHLTPPSGPARCMDGTDIAP